MKIKKFNQFVNESVQHDIDFYANDLKSIFNTNKISFDYEMTEDEYGIDGIQYSLPLRNGNELSIVVNYPEGMMTPENPNTYYIGIYYDATCFNPVTEVIDDEYMNSADYPTAEELRQLGPQMLNKRCLDFVNGKYND